MILTGCYPDKKGRYFAHWKVDARRFINYQLPKFVSNEPEAWIYALDHRPSWGDTLPTVSAEGGDAP